MLLHTTTYQSTNHQWIAAEVNPQPVAVTGEAARVEEAEEGVVCTWCRRGVAKRDVVG